MLVVVNIGIEDVKIALMGVGVVVGKLESLDGVEKSSVDMLEPGRIEENVIVTSEIVVVAEELSATTEEVAKDVTGSEDAIKLKESKDAEAVTSGVLELVVVMGATNKLVLAGNEEMSIPEDDPRSEAMTDEPLAITCDAVAESSGNVEELTNADPNVVAESMDIVDELGSTELEGVPTSGDDVDRPLKSMEEVTAATSEIEVVAATMEELADICDSNADSTLANEES